MDGKEVVAIYAAIVSSGSVVWQFYTWKRSGPIIRLRANPNMKRFGGVVEDPNTYIAFNVSNVGKGATTITHITLEIFDSAWKRFRRKPSKSFVLNTGEPRSIPLPYVLEPGRNYLALCDQDAEIEGFSRSHQLYGGVIHSVGKRPVRVRITPIKSLVGA